MGVLLTNANKEVQFSYIGFGNIRMTVANAISKEIGEIYKKPYLRKELTKEDIDCLNKNTPKYLDKFLWHSDCDGYFCKRDVKEIHKELIKLKPVFTNKDLENKYNELLELFSQEERIDLY